MAPDTQIQSAQQLLWQNAGEPEHKYSEEVYGGPCATCGTLTEQGISTERVNNPTFSNHAEFFRYGTHVCKACAWLYGDPKRTHRNVLAVGDELWWPMISVESATVERPSWFFLFETLADHLDAGALMSDTLVTGVLTSDPKPRNWPRMRLTNLGSFGLYVHAPEYDVSGYRSLHLDELAGACWVIWRALRMGFSKARIYSGLLADYAKAKKDMEGVMQLEDKLRQLRYTPEFIPALLVSGIKREEKDAGTRATVEPERSGEARGTARQDDDRLF